MKMNPATGRSIYKYHWMDKLSNASKANIQMYRDADLPEGTLSDLIRLLDQLEETQGGQLALQEKGKS